MCDMKYSKTVMEMLFFSPPVRPRDKGVYGGTNQIVVRALELILCRLRATLQGYLFKHLACLQEPSKTDLKPIL